MDVFSYKGFEIEAVPDQLVETGEWTTSLYVCRNNSDAMRQRHFSAGNCFSSRKEAVAHCFNLGKQIIDGESQDCTVSNL